MGLTEKLAELERRLILEALEHTGGNVQAAARELEIPARTLWRLLQEYNIDYEAIRESHANKTLG